VLEFEHAQLWSRQSQMQVLCQPHFVQADQKSIEDCQWLRTVGRCLQSVAGRVVYLAPPSVASWDYTDIYREVVLIRREGEAVILDPVILEPVKRKAWPCGYWECLREMRSRLTGECLGAGADEYLV
jgi:hypothetical protein